MGGESSTVLSGDERIFHEKFQLSQLNIEQNTLTISIPIQDEKNVDIWIQNLQQETCKLNSEPLLLPINHKLQAKRLCGSTAMLKITYPNFPYVFDEELKNRMKLKKHLQEEQLWYLLYCLTMVGKDFNKELNKKVGDIRPHNIFISESGQIKIVNAFSWPEEMNNYQKTLYQKQITYLAPEQINDIAMNKVKSACDVQKAQSFSTGLTLLHAGLLYSFDNIYNTKKSTIDLQILQYKIQEWKGLQFYSEDKQSQVSYSMPLKNIVTNLCMVNPQERQSCLQIYQLLKPYEDQIINLQPFQLNNTSDHNPLSNNNIPNTNNRTNKPFQPYYRQIQPLKTFKPINKFEQPINKFEQPIRSASYNNNTNYPIISNPSVNYKINTSTNSRSTTVNHYQPTSYQPYHQSMRINQQPNITYNHSSLSKNQPQTNILKKIDQQLMNSRLQFP